jgi:hypothetical protein
MSALIVSAGARHTLTMQMKRMPFALVLAVAVVLAATLLALLIGLNLSVPGLVEIRSTPAGAKPAAALLLDPGGVLLLAAVCTTVVWALGRLATRHAA